MSLKVVCMTMNLADMSLQTPSTREGLQTDGALVSTRARVHCHVAPIVTSC